MSACTCLECLNRTAAYMEQDERRVKAALAATATFTTEGLEKIAAGGYAERLALLASLMMEEVGAKEKREQSVREISDGVVALFNGVKKAIDKPKVTAASEPQEN